MSTQNKKRSRKETVDALVERDGSTCQYPGCERELDFSATGKFEVTIDHSEPQSWCRANGWTEDEIWDLSNLKLFEKQCNAKKGDLRYNPDGTLPAKRQTTFRYRRDKRASRSDMCPLCFSGRILLVDETCPDCGSGPQPSFPTAYQVKSDECPHEGPWSCFACIVGIVDRKPAYIDVFDIENSGIEE